MEHGRNTARNKKQLPKEPKHRLIRTFQSKSEKQPPKESKHGLVRTFQSNPNIYRPAHLDVICWVDYIKMMIFQCHHSHL